jgi:hypothetical protein
MEVPVTATSLLNMPRNVQLKHELGGVDLPSQYAKVCQNYHWMFN